MMDDISFHIAAALVFAGLVFLYLRKFRQYRQLLRMVEWSKAGGGDRKVFIAWPMRLLRDTSDALSIPLRTNGIKVYWDEGKPLRIDTRSWASFFIGELPVRIEFRSRDQLGVYDIEFYFEKRPTDADALCVKLNRMFDDRIRAKILIGK